MAYSERDTDLLFLAGQVDNISLCLVDGISDGSDSEVQVEELKQKFYTELRYLYEEYRKLFPQPKTLDEELLENRECC